MNVFTIVGTIAAGALMIHGVAVLTGLNLLAILGINLIGVLITAAVIKT